MRRALGRIDFESDQQKKGERQCTQRDVTAESDNDTKPRGFAHTFECSDDCQQRHVREGNRTVYDVSKQMVPRIGGEDPFRRHFGVDFGD